ncbi:MAG TPA: penicillin acylase family protein, partial [Arenibaculum sp.]|nr:penicillin acylase family protein [Arenibaculum sp.]
MRWLRRVLVPVLVMAVIVPTAALGGAWLWLRQGLPERDERYAVAGLDGQVEVLRDRHAIPHVFARSERDAHFALGWLHAQDRLLQMEMLRRIGTGRLAEVMGDAGLRSDRYMRTLGFHRQAEASYAVLSADTREALDAYARGVNAWLERRTGPLPLEFLLLRHEPEPWRPADSIVWGKLMALQLSTNANGELRRARLLQRLTPEQVADLDPAYPEDAPTTLAASPDGAPDGALDGALEGIDFDRWAGSALPELGPAKASNEWVLSGERTSTGKPLLVNDPHLGLAAPILWYLARVETPGLSLTGATVPGVPFHVLGHNGRIAWGLTTTGTDVQDVYVERLDPGDGSRYLTPDGPEPFTLREEVIRIKGGGEETLTVRETRHGPVISEVETGAADLVPDDHVLALAFKGLSGRDTSAQALHRLNRAGDWDAFRAALADFVAPQQNFVFADVDGNIGFLTPGRVPVRAAGRGRLPVPGWTGEYAWVGEIPFDELPQAWNPPSGRIVNANNRVVGPDYPWFLTGDWDAPYRARRIEQVLAERPIQDTASSEALLGDRVDLAARELLEAMLTVEPADPRAAQAVRLLSAWDGTMDRNAAEPLIFHWWVRELNRNVAADELGDMFAEVGWLEPEALRRMLTERTTWCDDVTTGETAETCEEIVLRSLDEALDRSTGRHGSDMAGWRWGAEHRAPLANRVLESIPVLKDLFDIGVETDGSRHTVDRGAFFGALRGDAEPFAHEHGAGYRAVYDMADPARSLFIVATGQSGNPLSPHYGDMVEAWR